VVGETVSTGELLGEEAERQNFAKRNATHAQLSGKKERTKNKYSQDLEGEKKRPNQQ